VPIVLLGDVKNAFLLAFRASHVRLNLSRVPMGLPCGGPLHYCYIVLCTCGTRNC
jgi:hypothetical protein